MGETVRWGIVVVGDEILSGKRQDKHFPKVVELLGARGLELSWVRYAGDDQEILTQTYRETFASGATVFSFGGIGGTPDDRTRQCAAAAAGLELAPHPEGVRELQARFGAEVTPLRQRMVEFPVGAAIIPNPINRVPGFSLRGHYFVPGFPNMAWPMVEWVLDTYYPHLFAPGGIAEQIINLLDCRESQITHMMEDFVERHPALRMSCLPNSDIGCWQLELGLRGRPDLVEQAMVELKQEVERLGLTWQPGAPG